MSSKGLFEQNEELKKENKRLLQFEDLYKDLKKQNKLLEEKLATEKSFNSKLQEELSQERKNSQNLFNSVQQSNQVLLSQVKSLQEQKDGK